MVLIHVETTTMAKVTLPVTPKDSIKSVKTKIKNEILPAKIVH